MGSDACCTLDISAACAQITQAIRASDHDRRLMQLFCRQVGPRPAGSAAMARGIALLAAEWSELGAADVHAEDVPLMAWHEAEAKLSLLAPTRRDYACLQCIYSGRGEVEGPLMDAGTGSPAEVAGLGRAMAGAIGLVRGGEIAGGKHEPIQKRMHALQAAGAAAVIMVASHPSLPGLKFVGTAGTQLTVPVVGISIAAGAELAEAARQGNGRVAIRAGSYAYPAVCHNLVGEISPGDGAVEVIILGAHLDSTHPAPGAFDNLTGVVTVTEVGRALAPFKDHFTRRLRLIAYTAEEYGFLGSQHYVRAHSAELDQVKFVLNLDSLFDSTAEGIAVMWSPSMRDYIAEALQEHHPEVDVRNLFCMSSDYLPYMLKGIPAARPADWRSSFPLWSHTVDDTEDKVPVAWLKANALVCAHLLLKMLTDRSPIGDVPQTLPATRKTEAEVRALVEQEGAAEALFKWYSITL